MMRLLSVLAATLLLGGCDSASLTGSQSGGTATTSDAAQHPVEGAFDYRYAFRLPASRIEAVQESHARGCDQLGPARCHITAMRYTVGQDNTITAVLTLTLDPEIARAFGRAAAVTVTKARGTMTDADVAGVDSSGGRRGDGVLAKLKEALTAADARVRAAATPDQKLQASAKADRLRTAIATIGEIDQTAGSSVATAPVIFTYTSSSGIPGIGASPEATLASAGDTFMASIAGLLVVLAGIGPWIVLLLGGALGLRWLLARTEGAAPPVLPPAPPIDAETNRNVIQRWFQRDEAKEHEPAE
jgi:hypothetical protein